MTQDRRFGPSIEGDRVRFRLWAPTCDDISIELESGETERLEAEADGWKQALLRAGPGTRYRYRTGNTAFPDPASRLQRGGVHGWSVVCAPSEPIRQWSGRPWHEAVLYELHAGLCGGFDGVAKLLPKLAETGITAVELMPIAAFPGARNWGYDGVLPFAPVESYGSPQSLRALIARAHALGIMMFLDVVYNHFGPDGNYLALCAKDFFRDDKRTPWGAAIDFRNPTVQQFFSENAQYWIHEFGFDGLRFDAVHAIADNSWLADLAAELRRDAGGRHIHLVLENDDNDVSFLDDGFDAQWNDDIHHVLHVLLTGEHAGYYADFAQSSASKLARALKEGFVFQGEPSGSHHGQPRGTASGHLAPTSFVAFLQNHDQIGNRAFGERLTVLADPKALKAAIALLLLSPQIPLIFMGEEIGSRAPFLYFTDHDEKLARIVREGRRREFGKLVDVEGDLPDPNAVSSFEASNPFIDAPDRSAWSSYYRQLLALRHERLIPHLAGAKAIDAKAVGEKAVVARWRLGSEKTLVLACNLGNQAVLATFPGAAPCWGAIPDHTLPPYTTVAWILDT
ncbi:MAG TPA: malto-oligosyltrehalose trehalohydrolase [Rhizomicrobium sp.]|nr:malto-oligosyltrehalose trehalohydrolase [Rhizomicrobium sp.]